MLLIKGKVNPATVDKDLPQVVLKFDFFVVGDLNELFFLQSDMENFTKLAKVVVR